MAPPIRFVFLELTNHCNFNCTFCPNGVMTRPRGFMDAELAIRLLDELASKHLTAEPVQLHVMGEPLLHPRLFEILAAARERRVPVRLFTNGALLGERNRARLFEADVAQLVIGLQVFSDATHRDHRRGKPDYATCLANAQATIDGKFAAGSRTRIELQFMNTKHFNAFRAEKGYHGTLLPLVDDNDKALAIIGEWKAFGRTVSRRHGLGFEPVDLEGLQGPHRLDPLSCVRGDHCEILPGVILGFKEIGTFCDYLVSGVRFVERYGSDCRALEEQLAVLSNGDCTLCCVDYDGQMAVGSVRGASLESVWRSPAVRRLREANRAGLFPMETCRVCRAFQVVDDYARRFPGREEEPYALERGWYPLERDGDGAFRWIGKRAILAVDGGVDVVAFTARPGQPGTASAAVRVSQGACGRRVDLPAGQWTEFALPLGDVGEHGRRVILESDEFWSPAAVLEASDDRRELSIRVRDVRVRRRSPGPAAETPGWFARARGFGRRRRGG